MKLKQLFTAVCLLFFSISISAQQYCLTAPVGYGSSATGGAGGTVTTVTTASALMSALAKSGKYIILVDGTLTFNSLQSVKATDKTVIGLKGAKIYAPGQSSSASGAIYFKDGSKNIIIRNLTFEGPGAYDCDGDDLLCFDGVTNAWVDHCDFQDGCDGNFDNKGNTDNITVSWCRFRYLKAPKAGGSGGSNDHRYTNLIGSSSSDKPSDGKFNITWAYCWWDEGCVERMTRCRNANLHFLNCYWKSSVAKCYIGPENVTCYLDGCTMEGSISTGNRFKSYGGTNGLKSVDCSGVPSNTGSVSAPSYSYTALGAAEAKTAVTNTTCGAGATLNVSVSGSTVTVLSPCNSTSYTITFNANGGSGTMANQTVYENMATTINANAFTKSGYAFQGWATSSGSTTVTYTNKASITLTKNLTLYAVWKEAQTYTITFNANGGSCSTTSLTYTDGEDPLTLPIPTLNGMVCTGWFTAASGGTKVGAAGADYTPTANVTLYAQWAEAPPCFVPGTATLGSGTTATLADGTKVTMTNCTINGENIVVSESGANILFEFPNTISAFSFTATCGSDGKNNYYSLNGNDEVALAASTKAAQTYEIPISGDVTSVKIRKSGTGITMTEICYSLNGSSSATTYTITYNTNGGSAIAQTTGVTKLPNPLPTPTKSGATFEGWYTNSGLTVAAVAGSTISANTTLYAKWTTLITGDVTFTTDNSIFPNPERGFYEHIEQTVTTGTNSSNLSDSYFTNGKAAGRSLILRLYYLNNFRETATLTQSVIDLINTDMQKLRDNGFKCILRFAYTNTASDTPSENKDGSPEIWKAHLSQLKSTLAANADVIYVVQAGFLGAWGEWYYSSQGKGENISMTTKNNLISQLLDAVPTSRVVQLRTPKFKTDYLGSNAALTASEAYKSTAKARLGHHNDAFLNGDENQGTYENVTADKAYIAQECLYVPVGGETNHDEGAATINTHATGDKAVAEMANLHYSYLNQGYSNAVTDLWRSTGHFDIMSRNLGYRFQLQAGTFSDEAIAGGTMSVNITLKNVGYAPLYYERPAYIVLKNATNTYSLKLESDPRSWQPNGATTTINENLTIPASVASGTYNLYLHLPDANTSLAAKPEFAVRFANTDVWESTTGYNKLNAQIVVTATDQPTYVVTFDANGHGTAPTAQTVIENTTATEPDALTATGYTFGGWYKEAACNNKFNFSTPITANTTLYAKWTAIPTYTVTLNSMTNGTVSASKTTGVNEGETITLTVKPATGYKVGTITVKDASDNNITLTDNKFIMPASNVTISATFTEISTGGGGCEEGTVGIITTTGANGEGERTMQTVDNITVTHQVVSTTSGAIAEYTKGDKPMYYASSTAIYSKGAYKWNVNTNSQDIETANNTVGYQVDVADGFTYSLSSLDFQMAASCAMVYKIAICNSTETLYLSDEFTITNYNKATAINYNQKIDLSGNSKVQSLTGSFVVKVYLKFGSTGKYFCFPNFTITGNVCSTATSSCTKPTFAWTTAPADGKVGNADITLGVNKGSSTGEVTYTSSNPSVATVIDGKLHYVAPGTTTITATLATDGTYCESSLAEEIEVTLSTYTLSYNLNGHGTAIANAIVNTLPNPLPEPTEAGWTFDGWYTNESLTTPATPGATISANTTLYAKWVENTYNVTINSATNGSVSVNKTEGIKANETVTLTISPNANYELKSLVVKDASNKDVTVTNNTFSMPSSNVTISATFAQELPTLVLTSGSANQTVNVNAAISTIKYTASGSAASIKVDGLPNGVTATTSGLVATISGKPSEIGTFNFSVTATNNESKTTVLSGKIVVNAVAPVITKPASTTISATQGVAITPITFTSDVATTFNVTGLPAGLSATTATDGKSVTISGTPTGYGTSNFTVSATAYGKTSSVSGSVTVAQKLPTLVLTSGSANQTVNVNAAISTIKYTASGSAVSIKVDGLPNGVTPAISGLVATISGKPSEVGTFNFSVTATNNESKTTVLSGKIIVNAVAPVITKPASTTISATQGVAITPITFTSDVVATFNVTGLPAGLSATTAADGKSVTISGTPTGYGLSNFTVSATAYGKTSSVSGSVTVAQKLPTIDLAEGNSSQAIEVNKPISTIKYNVGDAASIDVQGLPAGVDYSVNNGIVTISGTPTETGTFNYQVIAKNDEGKASTLNGNIVVTAKAPEKAPTLVLTSGLANQTINEKEAINTITYTASGTATTIEVENLPAGVSASINGLIAKISGTPETIGSTTYSVIATNSEGLQTTLSGTIIVKAVAPIISTPANTTIVATEGSEITPVTFSTDKVSTFEVVGLPNGLTYDVAADGKSITISGTPTEAGDFNYSVTAKADGLSSTIEGNCSIAEKPVAPEITEPTNGTQEIEVGTAIEDIVITVDKASEFEVNGLPNGLTYDVAADGKSITISGTPTVAGDFNYSVTAKADGLSNIFNGSFNITEPKDPSTGIDNATNVFQWKQTSNTISIEGANVKSMRLISLTGSLIAQSSNNSIEITSLPTGTYIVIAQLSNGQTSNYKFAK